MRKLKDRIDFLEQLLDYSYHYKDIEELRSFLDGHLKQLKKICYEEGNEDGEMRNM